MDRSFLYGIIVLLGITDALIYIQKTDPNLLGNLLPRSENWQKDPGWNQKPEQEKKEEKKEEKKDELKKDDKLEENKSPDSQEQGRKRHFRLFRSN